VTATKWHPRVIDLRNQRFGGWTPIAYGHNRNGKCAWACRCVCGRVQLVFAGNLKKNSGSCGCLKSQRIIRRIRTHGMSNTRVFRIWRHMIDRCHKSRDKDFPKYGAKGIKVCDRWRGKTGFAHFLIDMGDPGESSRLTIDRKTNRLGYSPSNCRWANYKVQSRNRSTARFITANGVRRQLAEWAEITGINRDTITRRIDVYGWTPHEAISTQPLRKLKSC
jgi:hypothetical protein